MKINIDEMFNINSDIIKKGFWKINTYNEESNDKIIKLSYQLNDTENNTVLNLIEIYLKKWNNKSAFRDTFYIGTCYVDVPNKELINILIEKLSVLHEEYNIAYNYNFNIVKEAQNALKIIEILENYNSENISISEILLIYNFYLGFMDFKNLYVKGFQDELLDKIVEKHQRDLALVPRDYLFAVLSRKICNFKTDDGELIIKLANKEYTSPELKKYEKEYGPINPKYNADKTAKIDYGKEYCSLMYATSTLLNDKKFIIKYIDNTPHNLKIIDYLSDEMKNEKTVIAHCLKKGYTLEKIKSKNNPKKLSIDDDCTISIIEELKENNKKRQQERKPSPTKIDWNKKNKSSIESGQLGEEIVFKYEIEKLKTLGRADLASQVKWVSKELGDGLGFDILSFDASTGEKIYIEVKSTKNNTFKDFEISQNEIAFASSKPEEYRLYWLNNIESDNPELFICNGTYLLSSFNFVPNSYKASYDETKNFTRRSK